ncbi:MAG: tryptophan synthase subunit alpha [Candidatus Eisenbacteria bacterium]|nr:tryptophan synthase subunit alpha [Candidatus Eisenbacteria bacterium]
MMPGATRRVLPRSDRLARRFEELGAERRTGLIPFLTCGDPSPGFTEKAIRLLDRPGTAAIEIGVPFSDPLADGPTIQRASERALAAGATLEKTIGLVARLRGEIAAPIVLMSYVNPILRFGVERFADEASEAGVDAVIATDLPLEESAAWRAVLRDRGIGTVFLAAPTSPLERIARIARACTAFLYYVSRTGVTGARRSLENGLARRLAEVRARTKKPLAVGFGVSRPEHARALAPHADAVVVGSALVRAIESARSDRERFAALEREVGALLEALAPGRKR